MKRTTLMCAATIVACSLLLGNAPNQNAQTESQYELVQRQLDHDTLVHALGKANSGIKVGDIPRFTEAWEVKNLKVTNRGRTADPYDFSNQTERCLLLVTRKAEEIVDYTIITYEYGTYDVLETAGLSGTTKVKMGLIQMVLVRSYGNPRGAGWWIEKQVAYSPEFSGGTFSGPKIDQINPYTKFLPAIRTRFAQLVDFVKQMYPNG